MNYRTTVTLAVLVAIGAIVWLGVVLLQPTPPTSDTIVFLEESLNKDDLTFIEVKGENPVKLTRGEDGKWSLQGNWPVRDYAVASLVEIITRLDSRFSPIMVEEDGLEKYGLDKDGLKVLIKINDNEHTLLFGEAEDDDNQFSRPTYLRLNDNEEILRLAPNLIAQLARPAEYYMQRRLFQYERAKKDEESDLTEEKLLAKSIQLKAEDKKFTLARANGKWQLAKPVVDRLDPDKVDTLLTAFPDIWAEKFFDQGDKDLSHFGLGDSAKQISVTQTDGKKISLMVGDVSRMETKKEPIPSPPPRFPGAPQPPPQFKDVEIPYYYARLKDNDQIFDVRGKILEKILVKSAELRDPQVARFDTDDVQKLEIQRDKARIVITRKKENWFLKHPFKKPAEGSDVRSLLSELSNAQVETEEIIDNANLKEYGLDSPAVVKLFLEEDKGGEEKTKVKKELVFRLGKKDADKKKVYLQLAKWSRIDPVDVSLLEGIQKPAISFRKRQLFDFSPSDLKEIQVAHQKESFTLGLNNSDWELSAPVKTDVDDEKAKELADDLSRLEVVEFVTDKASKKDLQEKYGLAKANLSVKVAFKEKDKRAETLVIGNPREKEEDKKDDKDKKAEKDKKEDKGPEEYYAKLGSENTIFVIKKNIQEAVAKNSLAYRSLELWELTPDDITEIRIRTADPEYALKKEENSWQISGAFKAKAAKKEVQFLAKKIAKLEAKRFVAHIAKDLKKYGLDQPYLRLSVSEKVEDKKKAPKQRVLLVGNPVIKGKTERFGRLSDSEAVFVVTNEIVDAAKQSPLDLLDKQLLFFNADEVTKVKVEGTDSYQVKKDNKGQWKILDSGAPPFTGDTELVREFLRSGASLSASKFAAYGSKVKWEDYGLKDPKITLTFTLQKEAKEEKKKPAEKTHTIAFGKTAKQGGTYVRVDNGEGVAVIPPSTTEILARGHLDFLNRQLVDLDPANITFLQRKMESKPLEIVAEKGSWKITKPGSYPADTTNLQKTLQTLAKLRADKIVSFPAKDLGKFGLDSPAAEFQVKAKEGKKEKTVTVKIGKVAENPKNGKSRYAFVEGSKSVGVIPEESSQLLLSSEIFFRNHDLAKFDSAESLKMVKGNRKIVFDKVDDDWKMTSPVAVDAEGDSLKKFIQNLQKLRADELVADNASDLKKYQLDNPVVRWEVKQGDKEVMNLLVGKKAEDGTRRYAKLDKGKYVFLLNPQMSRQATAEYRSQKLWDFKKEDIRRLDFIYPQEKEFLPVVQLGDRWIFATQQDVDVDKSKVEKVLDKINDLKPGEFVSDTLPEVNPYGMNPPEFVLRIWTEDERYILQLGKTVGKKNERYAAVASVTGTPVFLVSEATAQELMQNLKSLQKADPKEEKKDSKPKAEEN